MAADSSTSSTATPAATSAATAATRLHWPSLLAALAIMLAGTAYPPLMADASGKADHTLASLVMLAMAAGFVRGVGFVPRWWGWRWLFSGWMCIAALVLAAVVKWG